MRSPRPRLSRSTSHRTSGGVTSLFDETLRAARRDRAARTGPELFLLDRAFEDCLERLSLVQRSFRSALLLGCPSREWPERLSSICNRVDVFDPGSLFAAAGGGKQAIETELPIDPATYDLILAIGTLDTVSDLPGALLRLRLALHPDGLLLGAVSGGETLPRLRDAMRAADATAGAAVAHVHPRLAPQAVIGLLEAAGFVMPVVDVDRVPVSYRSMRHLVHDLRAMAGTSILTQRPRFPITRKGLQAAEKAFLAGSSDGRTLETFEVLHFAGWTPSQADPT